VLKRLDVADFQSDGLSHEELAEASLFDPNASSCPNVPSGKTVDSTPHFSPSDQVAALNGGLESVVAENVVNDEVDLEEDDDTSESWFDTETKAFFTSMLVHVGVIVGLAAIPIVMTPDLIPSVMISSTPTIVEEPEFNLVEEFAVSDTPQLKVGSNSTSNADMALSMAPVVSDVSEIAIPEVAPPTINAKVDLPTEIKMATGLVQSPKTVRGSTGVGVNGTDGAIDRITAEILRSIEERPTVVVWLFDASTSLMRRREEIRERFDHIYEELGIAQQSRSKKSAADQLEQEPLLTSIISFGETVQLLTKTPTADLDTIRSSINGIELDSSGVEMTFSALYLAAERYKPFRVSKGDKGPERNVMLIVVTDERGDDVQGADKTIDLCRKFAIPIYVLGVPAPFGRTATFIKYVDPDPKFDQTPQWAQIDQGPETILPERVALGYEDNFYEEPMLDSGFGPYAISRACYETGGMYFTIHPNRRYDRDLSKGQTDAFASYMQRFFDPEKMAKYKPDYLTEAAYMQQVAKSPLRSALIQAAQMARAGVLDKPKMRFLVTDEAALIRDLTTAQQESARLEPGLNSLVSVLQLGENARASEKSSRWLASYDLSYGISLSAKVRNETYNLMLAKAKRGMQFTDPKFNTWTLVPSKEISVSSKLEKEAEFARTLLSGVVKDHEGTPWAYLANEELNRPIGWTWADSYTDLTPPKRRPPNPNPPPANADDKMKMLKMPQRRPIPKL
jgi:hypothetical protein